MTRTVQLGDVEAPIVADGADWDAAQAALREAGIGDGLPLAPPTAARLDRMLAGRDPALSFGALPPLFGELTAEAVAYCCVLAGCVPAELPVVLEAAIATLEPDFNLLGIQTTTGTPTTALMVGGPAAAALGMNSDTNLLGPGNRANACLGRALRLVMTEIGGARPGVGSMATMGQPGRYGFAFAEGAHPWATPLHARRGLRAEDSAATVFGVSGTVEVLPEGAAETPEAVLRPALAAMAGAREAGSGGRPRDAGEQYVLLPPEMADAVARHGWSLADARSWLHRASGPDRPIARAPADIHLIVAGGAGVKMTVLVPWGGGTLCATRRLPPVAAGA